MIVDGGSNENEVTDATTRTPSYYRTESLAHTPGLLRVRIRGGNVEMVGQEMSGKEGMGLGEKLEKNEDVRKRRRKKREIISTKV
jgi:hypothetical protein